MCFFGEHSLDDLLPVTKTTIDLDFKTYGWGFNAESNEELKYKTIADADKDYFLDNIVYYQPFRYNPFELDIS